MKLRIFFDHCIDILFFLIIIISTITAISYVSNDKVFTTNLIKISDRNNNYFVTLELNNFVNKELMYDIEVIYNKENLVVGKKRIQCKNKCKFNIELDKVFFDKHKILITTEYENIDYKKKIDFNIEKTKTKNKLFMRNKYIYNKNQSFVNITGSIYVTNQTNIFFELFPIKDKTNIIKSKINCSDFCNFNININSNIVLGEYQLIAYLKNDVLTKNFYISYYNNKINQTKKINNSIYNKKFKININNNNNEVKILDIMGNEKNIKNKSNFELPQGYKQINYDNKKNIIKLKSNIKSINNLKDIKDNIRKNKIPKIINKKGFSQLNTSKKSFSIQSQSKNFNKIISEKEKIYLTNSKKYIEIKNFSNIENLSNNNNNKIIPGIYKYENIKRFQDGTEEIEENYFAYGLISINTKKPLYHPNETVEFLIVVLDKYGFLVNNANITLMINKPNNENLILDSKNYDILPTDKSGVYKTNIVADKVGKYNLSAIVELEDMIVDVNSYFNVVNNYSFDIIRDVPATIDPWQGPFKNNFIITPLKGYEKEYDFIETFSSEFEIINTSADIVKTINDTTYLKWNNLQGKEKINYIAQTPLKTPYLYYLGKSKIIYDNKEFYENRSWLFAIDPAAKVCSFKSPCICGASCSGGNEPGDGTIDSCGDGNTGWEFVNDIRVTNLNGDYFGTGNTVEICVDFDCDTSGSGDRVSIGYKDDTSGWINSDIIFETQCDYNFIRTHCINQTLTNNPGTHNVRGKIVYDYSWSNVNDICDQPTYYDHDDINFTVLDKKPAYYQKWNLTNYTYIGNNLNITWGENITGSALWDKSIQNAIINHNGNGSFTNYTINNLNNNYTNYTLDTSNINEFSNIGIVNISYIKSWDTYFNMTNKTDKRYFTIYGTPMITSMTMNPYITYNDTKINAKCKVIDENMNVNYNNYQVNFYHSNDGLLGTNTTNSSGWAQLNWIEENPVGDYNITCNISSNKNNYYIRSKNNYYKKQELHIKKNGSDIIPPQFNSINVTPIIVSLGGVINIKANVTDNVNLTKVFINITLPNGTSNSYEMQNIGGDIYEYNFSSTVNDGIYKYYVYAYDNSSNLGWSYSNKGWTSVNHFEVVGIRTFIGIKSTKKIYKIGENLNLTSYSKISTINPTNYREDGDVDHILYDFDTSFNGWTHGGNQDEWQRGIPSTSNINTCDNSNCIATDLNGNYNNYADNWFQSPQIDFTGRTNVKVTYWRILRFYENSDNTHFESYDGSSWNILFQDTTVPSNEFNLGQGISTFYPSEVEGVSNARFRFTLDSNWITNREGWAIDTFNISFTPKKEWDKSWTTYPTGFGSDYEKITAIKISVNITDYSSIGSLKNKNHNPDLQFQIYNGSSYTGNYKCNLDDTKSYPYKCEFVIKNTPEYINSWNDSSNRLIRFRTINLDHQDYINWTNVKREIVTPSIIENHGIAKVTSYLLQQFRNSTNGVVKTMHFAPISLNVNEAKELSTYWTYSVPGSLKLGNYSSYVALTDANKNVLRNDDDNTLIEDSYMFKVASLIINPLNPLNGLDQKENFFGNLTLDTTSYGAGGWCAYSFDGTANISMNQITLTSYNTSWFTNIPDGLHNIIYYCNDSDNYIVNSDLLEFNVSQKPRINYEYPTDPNNSYVNRSWTLINTSIQDSSFNNSWIEWNYSYNKNINCSFITGINYSCHINISNLKNNYYTYRICANDSLNNVNCTNYNTIIINKTLPKFTILSPLNNSKFLNHTILTNVLTNIPANYVWYEINNNGSYYFMTNFTSLNWTDYINLETGKYNITFYLNDSIGNKIKSNTHYFKILPDKNIYISKTIISISKNKYLINISLKNNGIWKNHSYIDYKNELFSNFSMSILPNNTLNIIGLFYTGDIYIYNTSLNVYENFNNSYYINGTGNNYNLIKNYMIGLI